MTNKELRMMVERHRIHWWEVAQELNCAPETLSRRLRRELPEAEKLRVLAAIEKLAAQE